MFSFKNAIIMRRCRHLSFLGNNKCPAARCASLHLRCLASCHCFTSTHSAATCKKKIYQHYPVLSFLRTFSSTPHDVGGDLASFGPILTQGHHELLQAWEHQCHALFVVLATKQIVSTDELRRSIESLTADQYKNWSYYEKWSAAMTLLLLDAKVMTHAELTDALFGDHQAATISSSDAASTTPMFKTGDTVRVKPYLTGVEWQRPHIRTPGYVYGVAGIVERYCGAFADPSWLAFGFKPAPSQHLYRVRFRMRDLWPEQYPQQQTTTSDGTSSTRNCDFVEVELYEHWLEPSDQASGHAYQDYSRLFDHQDGNDCIHQHDHENSHSHDHNEGDHPPHIHEARSLVEQRAVDREGPSRPGKQLHQALIKILFNKQVVTADDVRVAAERLDTAGKRLDGATLVVEAWTDPVFQEKLLTDAPSAANEIGITTSNPNAPTVLTVVANTPTTHNLVVCTFCSCYPSGLLGIAPSWYKSREYRSRAVREPRVVLKEFGLDVSSKPTIRIHDSTADHRYLVLPERPDGTQDWTKDQLRALVTRDTMIGVAVPTLDTA